MIKKITSIILTASIGLSFVCCGKKASETLPTEDTGNVIDCSYGGVKVDIPEDIELNGVLSGGMGYELIQDSGVYMSTLNYYAMTSDKYQELMDKDLTDEDIEYLRGHIVMLFSVMAINNNRGFDELNEFASEWELSTDGYTEFGKAGDCSFFICYNPKNADIGNMDIDASFNEEAASLMEMYHNDSGLIHVFEPVPVPSANEGALVSFETFDLNGNVVNSAELFASHKVTMINFWGTECGSCIDEMPSLAELNRTLADSDCAIVGIITDYEDINDEATGTVAREIVASTGADYTNLLINESVNDSLPHSFTPTSYFVDSEGHIIGEVVIGVRSEAQYTQLFTDALSTLS